MSLGQEIANGIYCHQITVSQATSCSDYRLGESKFWNSCQESEGAWGSEGEVGINICWVSKPIPGTELVLLSFISSNSDNGPMSSLLPPSSHMWKTVWKMLQNFSKVSEISLSHSKMLDH